MLSLFLPTGRCVSRVALGSCQTIRNARMAKVCQYDRHLTHVLAATAIASPLWNPQQHSTGPDAAAFVGPASFVCWTAIFKLAVRCALFQWSMYGSLGSCRGAVAVVPASISRLLSGHRNEALQSIGILWIARNSSEGYNILPAVYLL